MFSLMALPSLRGTRRGVGRRCAQGKPSGTVRPGQRRVGVPRAADGAGSGEAPPVGGC